MLGVVPPQGQDFALSFVDLHEILVGLLFQPAVVPLHTAHLLGVSTTASDFASSVSLLKVHSVSPVRLLMKNLNKTGFSIVPWSTPVVTGLQLDSCH